MAHKRAKLESQCDAYARFLDTGKHSDFEIKCGDHVFKVQKAIICAKSDFFDKMCSSEFSEGASKQVNLEEEDPSVVARLLLFIYTGTYPVAEFKAITPGSGQFQHVDDSFKDEQTSEAAFDWTIRAKLHASLYAAAEKYTIAALKEYSSRRFLLAYCFKDERHFDFDATILVADSDPPAGENTIAKGKMGGEAEAEIIQLVYESTPADCVTLRNIILYTLKVTKYDKGSKSPLEYDDLYNLIQKSQELSSDLASTVVSSSVHQCEVCKSGYKVICRRSPCGKMDRCNGDRCVTLMKEGSICFHCFRFGTLIAPKHVQKKRKHRATTQITL